MANTIQHKRSSTSGVAPVASGLSQGELAINIADGKFYTKNSANSVINLGVTSISGTYITPSSGNFFDYLAVNGVPVSVSGHSHTTVQQAESLVTKVFNETGSTLYKMTAVYINGGHGDRPTIQKAIATSDATSAGTYGLVYADIDHNQEGQVIVFGSLSGVNTDPAHGGIAGATEGSVLYLSPTTSGAITTTKPYAPDHAVAIGTVVRVHQNEGIIEVRVQNGFELDELHNVAISGATNGQFLQYNSTNGLWVPSSSGDFSSLTINNNQIVTGTGVANHIAYWNSSSGIVADSGQLYWDSTNNRLGIGTTTPSGQLHVVGTGLFSNSIGINTNSNSVGATSYALLVDGDVSVGSGNAARTLSVWGNNTTKRLLLKNVNGNSFLTYVIGSQDLNLGGPQPTDYPFNNINYYAGSTSAGMHRFHVSVDGTGLPPAMVIANSGVGIGTTSPSYTLDVSGTIGVSGIARFNNDIYMLDPTKRISWDNGTEYIGRQGDSIIIGTQSTTKILVNSVGNVGIGTQSPSLKLNVNPASDSNNGIQILNNSAGTSARSLLSISNGSYNAEISLGGTGFTNDGFYRQNRLLISGPFITDYVTGQHVFHIGGGGAYQAVSGSTQVGLWDATSLKVTNGIAGGNSAGSSLSLKSTDGVGTTDHIKLLVGNNGATEAMRIINNGNVGIGTTSPAESLTVYGDSKYLYLQAQNNTGAAGIKFGNTAVRQQMYIEGTSSDLVIDSMNGGVTESIRIGYNTGAVTINESGSDLDFRVEGDTDANLLFIDASADRVGIGTSTPGAKLDVGGSLRVIYDNPLLTINDSNSTNRFAGIELGTAGGNWYISNGSSTTTASADLFITRATDGTSPRFRFARDGGGGFGIYESSTSTETIFLSPSTSNSYINSSGNFGVGTASPSTKFHVSSTGNNSTTLEYTNSTAGFNSGVIPLKLLLTASNGAAVGAGVGLDFVTKSSSTEYIGGRIQTNRTDTSNNHALTFWAGGGTTTLTEYMRIGSNGNVGIGTTTPSGQLHVIGTGLFSNKLGVGTNAPTYDLDIRTNSDNALYVAQGAGARYLLFGNGGFINNTTLSVSKAAWSNLASLEVNTVIPARRGLVIEQVANQTANAIETRDNASTVLSYIGSGGGAYFGGNVGIGTTNPSVQLDVAGSGRFRGRCRVDNLTINTDTTTDNTAPYLATMLLGSDGASLSGGGLQITSNTNRDANKALLGLVNNKLKTLSGASTFAKTTFSSEYNADTSVNSTQTPNGNFVNILTVESGNLTLVNQNLYIKNSPSPTAYDNNAGTIINSQAYIYMQGASSGSPARFNNVYNYYSRGQFAASHSYTTNFVDFYAAPIVGQIVPSGGVTTRTALLIDYYDGNTAHITNPRGIWQLGSGVTNHLAGKVGIGTTSPNELLEVSGNLRLSDRSGSTGFKIQFNRGGGTANDYTIGKEGNHLAISTANDSTTQRYTEFGYHTAGGTWTPKTRLNNYTGALGVNLTATPSGSLDVGGDIYVRGAGTTGVMYFKSGSLADTTCRVRTDTNGNIYLEGGGANVRCGSQDGSVDMYAYSQWITIGNTYDAGTANQYVRFVPANTEMMRVTKTGVGFGGVTSPLDRIHVSGTQTTIRLNNGIGYDTQLRMIDTVSDWSVGINQGNSAGSGVFSIRSVTAGSHRLVINPSGDIGIGTISPTSKLHVAGDVLATGSFIAGSGSAGNPSFEFSGDTDTGMFSPSSNTIAFSTSGVERLRISSIGSVGIGTSSPVSRSHIYGGLTVDPLGVPTNNYSEGIRIGAASNGFSFVAFGVNPASATGSTTNQWWAGKNGATGGFTIYGNEAGESLHITTGSTVEIKGRTTLREGYFYEDGDAITREIVLLAQTTDSNPADMTFSGNEIMINYDRTYTFSALITARECSINGHVAGYKIEGVVTDQDGLATIVGTPVVTVFAEDNPDWDVVPSIYSAGMDNYLKFTVYPHAAANRNIRWVAKVTIVEVGTNGTGY